MTEAIIGLVGVVVGAGIAGAVSFGLERRRDDQRVRAAARLLEQELEPFKYGLYALRASVGPPDETAFLKHAGQLRDLTLDLWTTHRETLAGTLEVDEWYSVMYGYLGLGKLKREVEHASLAQLAASAVFADRVQSVESAVSGAVATLGRRGGRPVPEDEGSVLSGSRW